MSDTSTETNYEAERTQLTLIVDNSSNFEELPWYETKATIRAYLAEINKEKKVD